LALTSERAKPLAHADLGAGLNGTVNLVKVAVAVEPAAIVKDVDHAVARKYGAVIVAGQNFGAG